MLYFGTNIIAPADPLQAVTLPDLHHALRHPKPQIRQRVDQLRILQTVDKAAYRLQKKTLPYLVCGHFKPAIRRRENFVNTGYFMIDLDGIGAHFDKAALRQTLVADPHLVLLFTSPGGDGLKLLFSLAEKCSDYGLFSAFYKLFVQRFAAAYHLHAVMDATTSDVTRACFLSYDEEAYYNPEAEPVDMNAYTGALEPDELWQTAEKAGVDVQQRQKAATADVPEEPEARGPGADVMVEIRKKLNPDFRRPPEKQCYIPPEVDPYLEKVKEELERCGLQLLESSAINYGRKLKIGTPATWAEINLFYGKRGFTFVKTTKTGSNPQLAELCLQLLEQQLYGGGQA